MAGLRELPGGWELRYARHGLGGDGTGLGCRPALGGGEGAGAQGRFGRGVRLGGPGGHLTEDLLRRRRRGGAVAVRGRHPGTRGGRHGHRQCDPSSDHHSASHVMSEDPTGRDAVGARPASSVRGGETPRTRAPGSRARVECAGALPRAPRLVRPLAGGPAPRTALRGGAWCTAAQAGRPHGLRPPYGP
ncbi:hypothetical protein SFR_3503 [Streptomyces sp. FR-008]|nr:hypothetical protein SFR_3503 [Streptomyces sp. FR-008]